MKNIKTVYIFALLDLIQLKKTSFLEKITERKISRP